MEKNVIRLNEEQLREMIAQIVTEAYNTGQYASLAGRAQATLDNNKMKATFNPKWAERKRRQAELFGNMAAGNSGAYRNSYSDGTQIPVGQVQGSNYETDSVSPNYNGNNGTKKGESPFNYQRHQYNMDANMNTVNRGTKDRETYSPDQLTAMKKDGTFNKDSYDVFNLSTNNRYLDNNYRKGYDSVKKGTNSNDFKNIKQWQVSESTLHQIVAESVKNALFEMSDERYDEYGLKVPNWFQSQFNTKKYKEYQKARSDEYKKQLLAPKKKTSSYDYQNEMMEKKREQAIENLVWLIRTTNMGQSPRFDDEYHSWSKTWYNIFKGELRDIENEAWRKAKMKGSY